jgi:hypothetical protein
LERLNEFLTYGIMLDSVIVAYIQYVIMLIDLQKVLSQDLKYSCCCIPVGRSVENVSWILFNTALRAESWILLSGNVVRFLS